MRHLHFVQSLEPLQGGGLGRSALELHCQFLATRCASTLVTTRTATFQDSWPGVLQYLRTGPEKTYYSAEVRRHRGELIAAADIVHGHGFYVAMNWLMGAETRRQLKPFVYYVHGFFAPWILDRSRWKKQIAHWLYENANFRHAGLWRALTTQEAAQIRAQGITAPIVIAPNGVDLRRFSEHIAISSPKKKKRLLFLGRIHPVKGLDLLVKAWSQLGALRKEWELIIAGPDEGGYKAVVEEMLRVSGSDSSVRLVGPVAGDVKVALLQSANLFVLPSYSEGFSVAILEAMACKVPVVATDSCNFPELATEGGGWECKAEIESIVAALKQALSVSDEERMDRGNLAFDLVTRKYNWPLIAKQIIDACVATFGGVV